MKTKDKIITGLIIGGAIASVLGATWVKNRGKDGDKLVHDDNNLSNSEMTNKDNDLLRPKRKGVILRFLDWLDKSQS